MLLRITYYSLYVGVVNLLCFLPKKNPLWLAISYQTHPQRQFQKNSVKSKNGPKGLIPNPISRKRGWFHFHSQRNALTYFGGFIFDTGLFRQGFRRDIAPFLLVPWPSKDYRNRSSHKLDNKSIRNNQI